MRNRPMGGICLIFAQIKIDIAGGPNKLVKSRGPLQR
jgi:hypothetical protein